MKHSFSCWFITSSLGSKGWRSGESTRLPPMWPGFKSRRRRHNMWVEFVVGSLLCSERFFSGYFGFPLSSKTSISKFQQFDQESGRRRTLCGCATSKSLFIFLFIYLLFITTRCLDSFVVFDILLLGAWISD